MSWRLSAHVCKIWRLRPPQSSWGLYSLAAIPQTSLQVPCETRWLRTGSVMKLTAGEKRITALLTSKLTPTYIEVRDISGGCGSMYEIWIDSELFKGKRYVEQHRMVNEALGDEMQSLHGLTIKIGDPNQQ